MSQVQPMVGTSEEVSIVIDDTKLSLLNSNLQEKLKSLKAVVAAEVEQGTNRCAPRARIQKVPFTMRDDKKFIKYYEPTVVAIGPIHQHNQKLLKCSRNLKLRLAGYFIKENLLGAEGLCIKIKNELGDLKNCYEEEVISSWNDDDLTLMFLVDGCAVLQFIHSVAGTDRVKKMKELKMKNDQVAFWERDMFLMENQLPYSLLNSLISSIVDDDKRTRLKNSIQEFIADVSPTPPTPPKSKSADDIPRKKCIPRKKDIPRKEETLITEEKAAEPLHLLDLLRQSLTFEAEPNDPSLISKLLRLIEGGCCQSNKDQNYSFRCVSELRSAGIRLKQSKTRSILDISFKGYFIATLRLPPIKVDDSTPTKFLNLIALEMCPDFENNEFQVTSFVCFLDSLIDNPEDVKQLRKSDILTNNLGSDEEVEKIFNRIGRDLVPNPYTYRTVKEKIEMHYKSKVTTWVAQAIHDHFASPWTFLAFLAAILALALSFIQAWYSMHPAKDDKAKP